MKIFNQKNNKQQTIRMANQPFYKTTKNLLVHLQSRPFHLKGIFK